MEHELLVGAHMSIAGGIHLAFQRGLQAGCRALQVFLKNSNQWRARPLTDVQKSLYLEAQKSCDIAPVLAHCSYLINLGTPDRELRNKSLAAFIEELHRADFLGIPAMVVHPGAHMGSGDAAAIAAIATALDQALDQTPPPLCILLENTAGMGSSVGHRFEHLAAILDRVRDPRRIGICLDTCHLFAAGYDIRTLAGYRNTIRGFDRLIGSEKIRAFHLNDCRKPLGCRIDRHTHIGQGFIGLEAFRCLVNDPRFAGVPKIIETPKDKDLSLDMMNLHALRSLAKGKC